MHADESMAEAVREVMRDQYEVMVANEAGSRAGDDIEHVHDMRVAVRRIRTAFRLFGTYFQPKAIRQHTKDLRATGRALGQVRDLDVFNREAMRYLNGLPKRRRHDLDPLINHWHSQRETARLALIDYLDGPRYLRLIDKFGGFVTTPGAGVQPLDEDQPVRWRVRDVLSSTVWQLYETIISYDRLLSNAPATTLHVLRIDCKYLRYALEFFTPCLGPETPQLIRHVIAVQDHLGDIQDAEVAWAILSDFRRHGGASHPDFTEADLAHIAAYLEFRVAEQRDLIQTIDKTWPCIDSICFRTQLSRCLLAL